MKRTAILERFHDKDRNMYFMVTETKQGRGEMWAGLYTLIASYVASILVPGVKLSMSKQHSGAVTAKCPYEKILKQSRYGQKHSCEDEHIHSRCQTVVCFGSDHQYLNFSKENQVQLVTNHKILKRQKKSARSKMNSSIFY